MTLFLAVVLAVMQLTGRLGMSWLAARRLVPAGVLLYAFA